MHKEIKNVLRNSSVIKLVDPGAYTINLSELSSNTALENVQSAVIKRAMWSTNGYITITRNGAPLLTVYGQGDMVFTEIGYALASNSTYPIVVTINTGGSMFLETNKDANYNTALIGM